jgi:hypothetical protein
VNNQDNEEDFLEVTGKLFEGNKIVDKIRRSKFYRTIFEVISSYWLLCFFILLITYLELLYRLYIFGNLNFDYFFAFVYAISTGTVLYIIIGLFPAKIAHTVASVITFLTGLVYGVQLVYYRIFQTPLSLISVTGAGDALQFVDIIFEAIWKNIIAILLLFVPFILLLVYRKVLVFKERGFLEWSYILLFCVISYSSAIACVTFTGDEPVSQYNLYFHETSPELSINKLGVATTMRRDFEKLVFGEVKNELENELIGMGTIFDVLEGTAEKNDDPASLKEDSAGMNKVGTPAVGRGDDGAVGKGSAGVGQVKDADGVQMPQEPQKPDIPRKPYNIMAINFETLKASGKSDPLYTMHEYFSSVQPTATNQYTGMFEGCNLVMFTAEGFSPYVISPELTPTLYKMANEGFVFNNFYNPVWWVSTSDGEYVACTGLIPKGGVWSFYKSAENYMPFTMGNQFKKLGYKTKAYHNHTYSYYRRDLSHPNMGYDYKGVGNGLVIKETWPASDLEMIEVTADEYIGLEPFHAYYMTVSGHMNYNFGGNHMAKKNRDYVKDLPYSDTAKAYIACNLELEFALGSLMEKLEAAGVAENTVIVISSDHYPYGLEKKYLDELAGHEVEKNFELYKSTLIIYKKGMEPIVVDKTCASLDIIPTLSNLFGLDYDSRLLMGSDILSDLPALTIFSNRSWITDRAMYNSTSGKVTFMDGTKQDREYVSLVNKIVADKFKYSTKILETDYYNKIGLPEAEPR